MTWQQNAALIVALVAMTLLGIIAAWRFAQGVFRTIIIVTVLILALMIGVALLL